LVLVEGAGSPAETNLRANDIANMGFAQAAGVPVVLTADIQCGHAIAALVGAHAVLDAADRGCIRGFIINKFRGDARLFTEGLATIERYTGWPSLGVVPWLPTARWLPAEDAASLDAATTHTDSSVRIGILQLPHIANFDDFDPLLHEPGVVVEYIQPGKPLPGDLRLLIIPGSKSTIADLEFLYAQGWHIDIAAHVRRGGRVLGICGGYQMLGRTIADPQGIEGAPRTVQGLDLLDVDTVLSAKKVLRRVHGRLRAGDAAFSGYEMHLGVTTGPATRLPYLRFEDGSEDGATATNHRVAGCYVHGLFHHTEARQALLESLGATSARHDHDVEVDRALDDIAQSLAAALDIEQLLAISR
jgi:adenosylcobyric acid synthase